MTGDCIFCKVIAGTIPAARVYDDEQCIAFTDVNPQAPHHVLVVPKVHVTSLAFTTAKDQELLGHLMVAANEVARQQGLEHGYRVVVNTGPDGGQTVSHLHLHVMGGRHMGWPPG